ncbi:hypothetical protein INR49_006792 [Caranx melampygus]|nr:hypothetical protein INR49_006792 [Caranx melampygus]
MRAWLSDIRNGICLSVLWRHRRLLPSDDPLPPELPPRAPLDEPDGRILGGGGASLGTPFAETPDATGSFLFSEVTAAEAVEHPLSECLVPRHFVPTQSRSAGAGRRTREPRRLPGSSERDAARRIRLTFNFQGKAK